MKFWSISWKQKKNKNKKKTLHFVNKRLINVSNLKILLHICDTCNVNATNSYLHFGRFAGDIVLCSIFFLNCCGCLVSFIENKITSTSGVYNCVFLPQVFKSTENPIFQNVRYDNSSCECDKVVSDILAKLSFLLIWKLKVKTHSCTVSSRLKSMILHMIHERHPIAYIKMSHLILWCINNSLNAVNVRYVIVKPHATAIGVNWKTSPAIISRNMILGGRVPAC